MIGPTQAPGSTQQSQGTPSQAANFLGKDDFLKLLVGQLRNQNPMDPMGDQDFIGQMTQMSTLEQVTNVASQNQRLAASMEASESVALIGRTVTYLRADETIGEGAVESVTFGSRGPQLTIDGIPGISAGSVIEVR